MPLIRLLLVAILALAALLAAPAAASAQQSTDTGECVGDECDGGAWQQARGESNERSYWGMDPGHNCTNYVAWRLAADGVAQPITHFGDAATWAERAREAGYLVNRVPVVGAIAQWDAGVAGYSADGHVAYIERVNDDGTILVSEDYWLGGSQTGPLTYRLAKVSSLSNVIHFVDARWWLRTADASTGSWRERGMGLTPTASAMSAVRLSTDDGVRVFLREGTTLRVITESVDGWTSTDTGVAMDSPAVAAVDLGRPWPYVFTVTEGELAMLVPTGPGWQRMRTGIPMEGDFDAVDLGGLLPTIYVSEGGSLYEVWNDVTGWHKTPTGTAVDGPVSAVVGATGWPEVYSVENGTLVRSWADEFGWRTETTTIPVSGAFSAAMAADGVHVMLVQDGELLEATQDASGTWQTRATGIAPGSVFTTLDTRESSPRLVQLGNAGSDPAVSE